MLNSTDINALGNILDTTFASGAGWPVSINHTLQGNVLTLRYTTIVHFASEQSMRDQVRLLNDESMSRLNDKIADVKKQFKDMTGHAIKISELSNRDDLEMIQATTLSPRKIAYYRRYADLEIDV